MALVIPVILCGGSGTRLWPLSRSGFPKQFLVLSGDGTSQTLFQQAVTRVNSVANSKIALGNTLVVTNEDHRFLVLDQLREMKSVDATVLLEPASRNTAPALSMAAFCAQQLHEDPILVITPADQTIQNLAAFTKAIQDCITTVEASTKSVCILGITPSTPETGYGYIARSGSKDHNNAYVVDRFVEKPDLIKAQEYLTNGNYLWNSGMFVLRASTWLAALKEFRADIYEASQKAWQNKSEDSADGVSFVRPGKEEFKSVPSESIDYAVIEKCPGSQYPIKMVELDAGWNDLGAWEAVWQVGKKDQAGNVISGDVLLSNSKNSLVHASSRLVSIVSVENLIIIETADAVLVANRGNSQDVKNIVTQLENQGREEKNLHRKVARPWGWYDSVDEGEHFKVKRIQVTNGDQVIKLKENQSTYIPQGQIHRLANRGSEPLEIIEVQSGSYLGEDDIVRFEDSYGR
jgi:mannose-1-phosphate guanylyltransferase/mannose-6-phosphate isomerase